MITLTQAWQGKGGTEIQVFFVKIEFSLHLLSEHVFTPKI